MYALGRGNPPFVEILRDPKVTQALEDGRRPDKPESLGGLDEASHELLWEIIVTMWAQDPEARPSSRSLVAKVERIVTSETSEPVLDSINADHQVHNYDTLILTGKTRATAGPDCARGEGQKSGGVRGVGKTDQAPTVDPGELEHGSGEGVQTRHMIAPIDNSHNGRDKLYDDEEDGDETNLSIQSLIGKLTRREYNEGMQTLPCDVSFY
jgi:hypothetical protein